MCLWRCFVPSSAYILIYLFGVRIVQGTNTDSLVCFWRESIIFLIIPSSAYILIYLFGVRVVQGTYTDSLVCFWQESIIFFFKLSAKIHGVMSLKTVALSPQPSAYCSHRLLFWRVRIIAKSDFQLRHVCLSVRVEHLCSHWTDFHEILYLRIVRKSVEKIRVSLKSDKKNSYFTRRPMYIYDISLNNSWSEKWPY